MSILELNLASVLLLLFTHFLVATDRAFSKRVRRVFQLVLLSCLLLIFLDWHLVFSNPATRFLAEGTVNAIESLLRPFVLFLLIFATAEYEKKKHMLLALPLLVDVILFFLNVPRYCYVSSIVFTIILICVLVRKTSRRELADFVFASVLCIMLISSTLSEIFLDNDQVVNNCISVLSCVFYFYRVMKTFKKDNLTGLLMRHNLKFEIEDIKNDSYDIVLIDVDNFKLINDKYGHDKGDEALVTIVDTTLKHLPKGCRMYRFGGDEFVIISRKVSREVLSEALEEVNEELALVDYRMSYGIVRHEPGTDSDADFVLADKAMYENKRLLKSEDIWDDMTGLYNLRGFLDELDTFRKVANREGHMVCIVGVDVERLRNINKAYGYSEGNLIIRVLANCLKSCLRGRDFIGHLGSDEFVVAIDCTGKEDDYIATFISRLQELMATSYELNEKEYTVKLNIDRDFITAMDTASSEEYVNGLIYIKQEDKDNRRKNDISDVDQDYNDQEDALVQDILDNNKLQYAFQPIVSAKDGSIIAYESLMRSDTEVMVTPLKILKYAERNKRSYDVERFSLFNSLAKFAAEKNIPENVKIYINSIPGHLLNEVDFDLLKNKFGDYLGRVVLEITEQREIDDESLVLLNTRREKVGFNLAIDDYGSGVSNTNNLLRYMPQVVKLDRMLVTGIDRNAKKQFFVSSIISFAKDNDMLTLAEGVETESELKTVIKLGVDMIQGYVVAKPTIEVVTEIPEEIKKVIINENLRIGNNPRMTYTASESGEVSVVQLALEEYSKINISAESFAITGSNEYSADMIIKIKDNTNCHLTLANVQLNSVDDKPCIELGENCNLILNIEGVNKLNAKGIYVPESSSLTVIGTGILKIFVKGHECYAIGTGPQEHFGNISLRASGLIELNVDGEECVGIGGGIATEKSAIYISTGTVNMTVAGVDAVGVGSYKGKVPIRFVNVEFISVFRVNRGTVIGSMEGELDIETQDYNFNFTGSGTELSVIGCPDKAYGKVVLNAGAIMSKFNGHIIFIIGGQEGNLNIAINHTNISLMGEGDFVTGFGTRSEEAQLLIQECGAELIINASSPMEIGAKERTIQYIGPNKQFIINGVTKEIYEYC